jgi:hypothetical protein
MGGVAARRVAALRVMLAAYPVEAVLLGLLALMVGGPIHSGAIFWGCLYGVGQAFGMWAFYAALGCPGGATRVGSVGRRRAGNRGGDVGQSRGDG